MINSHALLFMLGGIFMTHEQFEKAADYWKNKGITAMPKEELKKAVEEYIDYYNNKRIQAKTKWMPPVQYRIASMCSA